MFTEYKNEPLTDFNDPANVSAFRQALDKVKSEYGRTYPLVIGGKRIELEDTFPSVNPARKSEVVGHFANGTAEHADQAIEAAGEAFKSWQYVPAAERAQYLIDVAAKMRERKHEFSATMVLEIGKSWVEADADTAEALDFLEYYARQMVTLEDSSDRLSANPLNEKLEFVYVPLGVGAIIPPWNFANAILTGLTCAGIVAGNAVVLKPAEQSPLIGYKVAELFWEVGLPDGVLNFLTGPGEVVGARMVEHPDTRFVAFTGSREVGTGIYEKTATVKPDQKWLKRAILEMGGKDAIVVDETADLDAAAEGIVASAFGFQGQKCSAGSRAIIVESVYDQVIDKVVERARALTMGATDSGPDVYMGPVVDDEAFDKVRHYIDIGKEEGKLVLGGETQNEDEGYFIVPTVFVDVDPKARIAQEEIFGPVVSVIKARDFDDALNIANDTDYGLTGSLYSNDSERIERAKREFFVGNLYFNRKCTGSLVGVHPFGGFNMSGTDSKAGGPDYLTLFTQAKSIATKL